jgi:hypothetical protein
MQLNIGTDGIQHPDLHWTQHPDPSVNTIEVWRKVDNNDFSLRASLSGTATSWMDYDYSAPGFDHTLTYKIRARDGGGIYSDYTNAEGIKGDGILPKLIGGTTKHATVNALMEFGLEANYPNPFNPATTIAFRLAEPSHVQLKVHDALGREVATLVDGYRSAGRYEVKFDASGLSSGTYFYTLVAGDKREVKRMVVAK